MPIVVALAFFFSLWLFDFPKPMFDDLFYTGAALNMAKGGDFSNPLLARQGFPGHYFFVYPPLHSYVLFGWLKVFGVNARSMTGFAIAMITITALGTIMVLRRHSAGIWLELAAPLGAAFALLGLGLRPDTLAMALTMAGFALTNWRPKSSISLALGFLLMFLGASAAPRVTLFAAALAVCAGYESWRQAATPQKKWRIILLALGAGLLTGLMFLSLIHFRVGEFISTFKFHSTRIGETRLHRFVLFVLNYLRVLSLPLLLIPLGLIIFLWRKPKTGLSRAGIAAMAPYPLAAWAGLLRFGGMWWMVLAMLLLAGAAFKITSARFKFGLTAIIMVVLLVVNRWDIIAVSGILSGEISADLGEHRDEALAMRPSAQHPLLVDTQVARYLYNYRIPEGVLNLDYAAPFPGTIPGCAATEELRPGDVYLAGPRIVAMLISHTYLEQILPTWSPFGIFYLSQDKDPRHVYVIRAEDCKGTREKLLRTNPGRGQPLVQ